jgi:hypothetical protein
MNAVKTGLTFAAAIGLAATLGAQSPTSTTSSRPMTGDKDHDVTITGCLSKGATDFTLNNARLDTEKTTSTASAAGSTSTATATGTTGTAASSSAPNTWKLTGDNDLDKHVGHKIQVTGKTTWDASMEHGRSATSTTASPSSSTSSTSSSEPTLNVKSIKMVASSCQ